MVRIGITGATIVQQSYSKWTVAASIITCVALSALAVYVLLDKKEIPPPDIITKLRAGNLQYFRQLSKTDKILHSTDHNGWTVLHHAAYLGNQSAVKLLICAGVDTSLKTTRGKTPLDLAREQKHTTIESWLSLTTDEAKQFRFWQAVLEQNPYNSLNTFTDCDLEATENGLTPLQTAVSSGLYNSVQTLIDMGADTSIVDSDQNTLLHLAIQKGDTNIEPRTKIIQKLLGLPLACDWINRYNRDGQTPFDLATLISQKPGIHIYEELLTRLKGPDQKPVSIQASRSRANLLKDPKKRINRSHMNLAPSSSLIRATPVANPSFATVDTQPSLPPVDTIDNFIRTNHATTDTDKAKKTIQALLDQGEPFRNNTIIEVLPIESGEALFYVRVDSAYENASLLQMPCLTIFTSCPLALALKMGSDICKLLADQLNTYHIHTLLELARVEPNDPVLIDVIGHLLEKGPPLQNKRDRNTIKLAVEHGPDVLLTLIKHTNFKVTYEDLVDVLSCPLALEKMTPEERLLVVQTFLERLPEDKPIEIPPPFYASLSFSEIQQLIESNRIYITEAHFYAFCTRKKTLRDPQAPPDLIRKFLKHIPIANCDRTRLVKSAIYGGPAVLKALVEAGLTATVGDFRQLQRLAETSSELVVSSNYPVMLKILLDTVKEPLCPDIVFGYLSVLSSQKNPSVWDKTTKQIIRRRNPDIEEVSLLRAFETKPVGTFEDKDLLLKYLAGAKTGRSIRLEAIQFLIDQGADVTQGDPIQRIFESIHVGNWSEMCAIVTLLMERGAKITSPNDKLFWDAVRDYDATKTSVNWATNIENGWDTEKEKFLSRFSILRHIEFLKLIDSEKLSAQLWNGITDDIIKARTKTTSIIDIVRMTGYEEPVLSLILDVLPEEQIAQTPLILDYLMHVNEADSDATDIAVRDKADSDVTDIAVRDKADSDVTDIAVRDKADSDVTDIAVRDKADSDVTDIVVRDKADSDVTDIVVRDKADSDVTDIAVRDKADSKEAKILKRLIKSGADISCCDSDGHSPLEFLQDILSENDWKKALSLAPILIRADDTSSAARNFRYCLYPLQTRLPTPVHPMVLRARLEKINKLSPSALKTQENEAKMLIANYGDQQEAAEYILSYIKDPECIAFLLQLLKDNELQNSDLIVIYLSRTQPIPHIDVIQALANKGAPIDAPIADGTTPLIMAIDRLKNKEEVTEYYKIIQYLIEKNANLLGANKDLKEQRLNLLDWVVRAAKTEPHLIGPLAMMAPYIHAAYDPLIATFITKIREHKDLSSILEWLQAQSDLKKHVPYFKQYQSCSGA